MTFDFVLNNTDPLVFPDSVGLEDNLVYDPETGNLYDPQVDTNENDYEYRWSQNRWVSHVDLSMRKKLDDNFVNIPGDVMTGPLQMGEDILQPVHPMFIVARYDIEGRPWLPGPMILVRSHTLRCNEYVLGNRVTVDQNAVLHNIKKPEYETKWYKLKLNPTFETSDPYRPEVPTETDWANMIEIGTGTNIVLSPDLIEGDSYIRSIQTITETSDEIPVKPSSIQSICDTPFIGHQTTIN